MITLMFAHLRTPVLADNDAQSHDVSHVLVTLARFGLVEVLNAGDSAGLSECTVIYYSLRLTPNNLLGLIKLT